MEKIFWYVGYIFSLYLVNVNLKNSANPSYMNGWDCKWWWQLCTGGDDPQLQWRDSQEVDATCSSQPPARGPSLKYKRRLEVEQLRKAKSYTPPAVLNHRDLAS